MHDIEALYIRVYRHKVNLMSRILQGDYPAGEDVVQEAFTRAWRFYPSYDQERGEIEVWFNSILFNSLRDYQRQKRGDPPPNSQDISPEEVLQEEALVNDLIPENIAKISNPAHRRILNLFFTMGYNSADISQIEPKMTQTNVTTIVNRFKERVMP